MEPNRIKYNQIEPNRTKWNQTERMSACEWIPTVVIQLRVLLRLLLLRLFLLLLCLLLLLLLLLLRRFLLLLHSIPMIHSQCLIDVIRWQFFFFFIRFYYYHYYLSIFFTSIVLDFCFSSCFRFLLFPSASCSGLLLRYVCGYNRRWNISTAILIKW